MPGVVLKLYIRTPEVEKKPKAAKRISVNASLTAVGRAMGSSGQVNDHAMTPALRTAMHAMAVAKEERIGPRLSMDSILAA